MVEKIAVLEQRYNKAKEDLENEINKKGQPGARAALNTGQPDPSSAAWSQRMEQGETLDKLNQQNMLLLTNQVEYEQRIKSLEEELRNHALKGRGDQYSQDVVARELEHLKTLNQELESKNALLQKKVAAMVAGVYSMDQVPDRSLNRIISNQANNPNLEEENSLLIISLEQLKRTSDIQIKQMYNMNKELDSLKERDIRNLQTKNRDLQAKLKASMDQLSKYRLDEMGDRNKQLEALATENRGLKDKILLLETVVYE